MVYPRRMYLDEFTAYVVRGGIPSYERSTDLSDDEFDAWFDTLPPARKLAVARSYRNLARSEAGMRKRGLK